MVVLITELAININTADVQELTKLKLTPVGSSIEVELHGCIITCQDIADLKAKFSYLVDLKEKYQKIMPVKKK